MASKILTPTASYTAATRSISGATMTPVFELADQTYQRSVTFWIGTSVYWGRVGTFVSTTSVVLLAGGNLPVIDGVIAGLVLSDTGEAHSYQSYKDEIASLVKDDPTNGKLTTTAGGDIEKILARAVSTYNTDKPWYVRKKVTGNGTKEYAISSTFGSLWTLGMSIITAIEYPTAQDPPEQLEGTEYEVYDDGTAQDGTNLKLRFWELAIPATAYFNATFLTERRLSPSGTQNFPDTMPAFRDITLLAASIACAQLAAAFAPSTDSTINVDVVNYSEKTRKYMDLAKMYRERYNVSVFGNADTTQQLTPAVVDVDVDLPSESSGRFIFHGGANR